MDENPAVKELEKRIKGDFMVVLLARKVEAAIKQLPQSDMAKMNLSIAYESVSKPAILRLETADDFSEPKFAGRTAHVRMSDDKTSIELLDGNFKRSEIALDFFVHITGSDFIDLLEGFDEIHLPRHVTKRQLRRVA